MNPVISTDCCGSPLKSGGLGERVRAYKSDMVRRAREAGIAKVVFACPGCRDEFSETEESEGMEFVALPRLLADAGVKIGKDRVLAAAGSSTGAMARAAVFDSCHDRDGAFGGPLRSLFEEGALCELPHCGQRGPLLRRGRRRFPCRTPTCARGGRTASSTTRLRASARPCWFRTVPRAPTRLRRSCAPTSGRARPMRPCGPSTTWSLRSRTGSIGIWRSTSLKPCGRGNTARGSASSFSVSARGLWCATMLQPKKGPFMSQPLRLDRLPRTVELERDGDGRACFAYVDQRLLPGELSIVRTHDWRAVVRAIETLAVRGAPAIGVAGAAAVAAWACNEGASEAASHGCAEQGPRFWELLESVAERITGVGPRRSTLPGASSASRLLRARRCGRARFRPRSPRPCSAKRSAWKSRTRRRTGPSARTGHPCFLRARGCSPTATPAAWRPCSTARRSAWYTPRPSRARSSACTPTRRAQWGRRAPHVVGAGARGRSLHARLRQHGRKPHG